MTQSRHRCGTIRMRPRTTIVLALLALLLSCSQPVEVQVYNRSQEPITVQLGEGSRIIKPGKSFRFSDVRFKTWSVTIRNQRLQYTPEYWDLDYFHQRRCGLLSCRVVYLRFDSDLKIRIVKPENRNESDPPETQPDGYPLTPIAD